MPPRSSATLFPALTGSTTLHVWPDHASERRNVDRSPDSVARDRASAAFDELESLTADGVGAGVDGDLSFVRFPLDALESNFSEYRKTISALALIRHLADRGRGVVTHAATSKAIRRADYLESHPSRVCGAMRAGEVDAARKVREWIRRGDVAD